MQDSQCPICFGLLGAREVTPCFICGGWPESVASFDPSANYREFRLPDDQLIVLCSSCELEEFMVPNGWGYKLVSGYKLPVNALQPVRLLQDPQVGRDKFCPSCNLRLAFLRLVSSCQKDNGNEIN